jgi:hypothetical protein
MAPDTGMMYTACGEVCVGVRGFGPLTASCEVSASRALSSASIPHWSALGAFSAPKPAGVPTLRGKRQQRHHPGPRWLAEWWTRHSAACAMQMQRGCAVSHANGASAVRCRCEQRIEVRRPVGARCSARVRARCCAMARAPPLRCCTYALHIRRPWLRQRGGLVSTGRGASPQLAAAAVLGDARRAARKAWCHCLRA